MNPFKRSCFILALGITTAMVSMDHVDSLSAWANNLNGTVHDHGVSDEGLQKNNDSINTVIEKMFIYPTDHSFLRLSLRHLEIIVHKNLALRQTLLKDWNNDTDFVDPICHDAFTQFFRNLALRTNIELLLCQMSPSIATYLDGSPNNGHYLGNIINQDYDLKQINDMIRSHDPVQLRLLIRHDIKAPTTKAAIAGLISDYDRLFDSLTYSSDSDEDSAFGSVSSTSSDVSSDYGLIGSDSETVGSESEIVSRVLSGVKYKKPDSNNAYLPQNSPLYDLGDLFAENESNTPKTISGNTPYASSSNSGSSRSSPVYDLENLFAEDGSNTSNQCHGVRE